ncbi:hypothetical protein DUNSADRAFT_10067 [Dunaliella salina]|uniref:Encoded protein n=1 Tax=Dunaliella salina TaxID=3046 RepID=A0ABQ7GG48_DUNSA|nr:hypothetical protein DUNSADRAFT_10067 [Dunaliella salina]|eukprot:KAF5833576.1 hypothetical protein DUNSADRAFT_10067 [Dunaliella salina]
MKQEGHYCKAGAAGGCALEVQRCFCCAAQRPLQPGHHASRCDSYMPKAATEAAAVAIGWEAARPLVCGLSGWAIRVGVLLRCLPC